MTQELELDCLDQLEATPAILRGLIGGLSVEECRFTAQGTSCRLPHAERLPMAHREFRSDRRLPHKQSISVPRSFYNIPRPDVLAQADGRDARPPLYAHNACGGCRLRGSAAKVGARVWRCA